MSVCGLIMARYGSERVRHKNIIPFAGSSLLQIKIGQMLKLRGLEEVIVNSESDSILEIACEMGATPIRRDAAYATRDIPACEMYRNVANSFPHDYVFSCCCTVPLMDETVLQSCLDEALFLIRNPDPVYDSLNTVSLRREFLWRDGEPLNYDPETQTGSQGLPDIYAVNFGSSFISRSLMFERGNVVGRKPYLRPTPPEISIDIDTEFDFHVAEMLYRERNQ